MNPIRFYRLTLAGLSLLVAGSPLHSEEPAPFLAYAPGNPGIVVTRADQEILRFNTVAWGPNWSWAGLRGKVQGAEGVTTGVFTTLLGNTPVHLDFRTSRSTPTELELTYTLRSETAADLTLFVVELKPGPALHGNPAIVESQAGQRSVSLPFGRGTIGERVRALRFTDSSGQLITLRFDPPCTIEADNAARLVLARDRLTLDEPRKLKVSVELPEPPTWFADVRDLPDEPGLDQWYPFTPQNSPEPGEIGMADWLEKPAGQHGRIERRADSLVYHDEPIKLWGLNLCYSACTPDRALADRRAALYPKYGINAVRLHKFADGHGWAGIQTKTSVAEFEPETLDRFDYQVAKFKEAGIYVVLSAHFGTMKMGSVDRRDVPFLEEFGTLNGEAGRVSAPHSSLFYSPDLQKLHLRQILNLLNHRNPYTALTYAEDPAVAALEIINEQSILFYTSMEPLKRSSTLRHQIGRRFSRWLREKYGSEQGLTEAWGDRALDSFSDQGFPSGEALDRNSILPLGNPWYWDPDQLNGSEAYRRQRLLDTLQFLYELQCEAYDRYVAEVRTAGYKGEIMGSNWQAGRALGHYANLHSDARVGTIDRHNYFGGGRDGRFNAASMLAHPGSGSLSTGLQQVEDRPFMLSEWIHVFPNEWGVEGPAIIGAYGLGLQGWDASFLFQNGDDAGFSRQLGRQVWDVMAPQILGIFPAVARQVIRGDVTESQVVAPRHVHVPSLFENRLGFEERVTQGYDDKELDSSAVPARALAAVRCVVTFTGSRKETPRFDLDPFVRQQTVISSTRQLHWKQSADNLIDGYFTVDTPATTAVVGFARDQTFRLGNVRLTPQSRFAALYVTAPERDGSLANSTQLLVVALARARNTGMKFNPTGDELLARGQSPVLLEPVRARIAFTKRRILSVHLLDHDGRLTDRTLPLADNVFSINGAADRTPYYLVRFQPGLSP